MTRHPDTDVLAGYREGLLGRRRSARVRAHLAGCPHCTSVEAGLADVTALLASSPAPVMPADVIARLDSALAAEAARRPQATGAATGGAGNGAAGPLPAGPAAGPGRPGSPRGDGRGWWPGRRPARPSGQARPRPAVLGAAAAAMIVLAGAGYGLASLAQQQGGASASAGAAAGGTGASAPNRSAAAPEFHPAAGLHVIASGTDYQPGTLAHQAEQALTRHSTANPALAQGTNSPAGQTAAPPGRAATAQQQACVMLVTGGRAAQLVDVARYRGRPATIIVQAPSAGKPGQVWVAGPACSARHRDILAHTSLPSSG